VKYYAIIVAGGSGSRMQSAIPKQFMLLNGKPVIMYTIEAFYSSDIHPEIILVLNSNFHNYWSDLCREFNFTIPHKLVRGGKQRFDSVKNGINSISHEGIISIHDAVRPLVSNELICRTFREAELSGSAIAAIKSKDSVRKVQGKHTFSLNRDEIFLIQTPQAFRSELLHKAYQQEYSSEFTDDATVVEQTGVQVKLTEGDLKNIKITFPEDILLAECYLKAGKHST